MSGKRLPEEHQEAIRERLRLLLKDVFADQKQAAKALGIDQTTISKAINGGAVGYGTLNAVANYLKVSTDEITGRSIERSSRVEPDEDVHSPAYESSYEIERYDALPQWPHYVAYVKRKEPAMPQWPIDRAGAARPFLVGLPTPETILQLCRFIEANDQPPATALKISK